MIDVASTQMESQNLKQLPATDASRLAFEVARLLRESGLAGPPQPAPPWISLGEAAQIFGYSASRFYHVYDALGLVPSRASQRKLRFNRQDVERTLRERQKTRRGRPRRNPARERIEGTKPAPQT